MVQAEDESAFLNPDGTPADDKLQFMIEGNIIGECVVGVRICNREPADDAREDGAPISTLTILMENGASLSVVLKGSESMGLLVRPAEPASQPEPVSGRPS